MSSSTAGTETKEADEGHTMESIGAVIAGVKVTDNMILLLCHDYEIRARQLAVNDSFFVLTVKGSGWSFAKVTICPSFS